MTSINRKSFNISERKQSEFDIVPFSLSKSFSIYLKKESNFDLVIYGFNLVDKYLLRMKNSIVISPIATLKIKAISSLQEKLNLIHGGRITIHQPSTISSYLSLQLNYKDTGRDLLSLSNIIEIIFGGKFSVPTVITLNNGYRLQCYSSTRVYYDLSYYDTQTLGDMDTKTLAELDYLVSTSTVDFLFDDNTDALTDDNGDFLKG